MHGKDLNNAVTYSGSITDALKSLGGMSGRYSVDGGIVVD